MRLASFLILVAACDASSTLDAPTGPTITCGEGTTLEGTTCIAPVRVCGSDTHLVGAECVVDPLGTGVSIRTEPRMYADGTTAVDVRVWSNPGFHNTIVLNTDRSGAGTFASPSFTLDDLGGSTTFVPCSAAIPGCAGPLTLSVAYASAPATPIATTHTELVASPTVGSMDGCGNEQNVFYIRSPKYLYRGALTILEGLFTATGASKRASVTAAWDPQRWTLEVSTVQLDAPLAVGAYLGARNPGAQVVGKPGIALSGGFNPDCEWEGAFEIHDVAITGTVVDRLAVSFRQYCITPQETVLQGCLRYTRTP